MPSTETTGELLDTIIGAEHSLVVLRCGDVSSLLELLHRHAILTGLALYAWDAEEGLRSLRDAQVPVPGSRRFGDALRHVIQSAHFGIYFFAAPPQVFDATLIPLLRQASRLTGDHVRRVVLLGGESELPAGVEAFTLNREQSAPLRPRLRDGHWVKGSAG